MILHRFPLAITCSLFLGPRPLYEELKKRLPDDVIKEIGEKSLQSTQFRLQMALKQVREGQGTEYSAFACLIGQPLAIALMRRHGRLTD